MDLMYFLLLVLLLTCLYFLFVSDCDFYLFICSHFGKKAEKYRGKVVWITGASSGIGETMAKQLAAVGARLVLSARRKEELERVKQACLTKNPCLTGTDILVLPLDVTKFETHDAALKSILNHFGKLDVLLNNAGLPHTGESVKANMRAVQEIFVTNVFSAINLAQVAIKYFMGNGGGQVAVMSSLGGRGVLPLMSLYFSTKHAIHGYFNAVRMEMVRHNIDVNLICPGFIDTPIYEKGISNEPGKLMFLDLPKTIPGIKIKMSVERCAYLSIVAMANGLKESWISESLPFIPYLYLQLYFPNLAHLIYKVVGWRLCEMAKKQLKLQ